MVSEARYQDLIAAEQEAHVARVRVALEDVTACKVMKFATPEDLFKALDAEEHV